ncbi:hypothetical protein JTB14_010711 [Gonioctena quinquepunctata]|nr:hypothetical protein JTB14_010711 [Gonioctena quinquepunctata]
MLNVVSVNLKDTTECAIERKNQRIDMCKLYRKNPSPRKIMRNVIFMKSKQRMIVMHRHISYKGLVRKKTLDPITFKLDKAADITMLPLNVLKDMIAEQPLGISKIKKYKNRDIVEIVFVSKDIEIPFMSRKVCQNMNRMKCIYAIDSDENWFEEYPFLLKGPGNIEEQYKMEII